MGRNQREKIVFEKFFDPTLKKRIEDFLANDGAASNITRGLLVLTALGGILTVGAVVPNLMKIFALKDRKKLNEKGYFRLKRSFYELRKRRYIERAQSQRGDVWRLTSLGKKKLERYLVDDIVIPRPRRWDKKWRLIFFDIPDSVRYLRDSFRIHLRRLECCLVQKSVWAHPFQCQAQIYEIARSLGITKYVDIYTIEDFDNPRALSHFRSILKDFLSDH